MADMPQQQVGNLHNNEVQPTNSSTLEVVRARDIIRGKRKLSDGPCIITCEDYPRSEAKDIEYYCFMQIDEDERRFREKIGGLVDPDLGLRCVKQRLMARYGRRSSSVNKKGGEGEGRVIQGRILN